jgi:hypothetical protein
VTDSRPGGSCCSTRTIGEFRSTSSTRRSRPARLRAILAGGRSR